MKREPKTEVIFVKVDTAFAQRVKAAAYLADTTMSQLTREALRAHLDRLSVQYPQLTGTGQNSAAA